MHFKKLTIFSYYKYVCCTKLLKKGIFMMYILYIGKYQPGL